MAPAPVGAARELLRFGWEFSAAACTNPRVTRRSAPQAATGRRQPVLAQRHLVCSITRCTYCTEATAQAGHFHDATERKCLEIFTRGSPTSHQLARGVEVQAFVGQVA